MPGLNIFEDDAFSVQSLTAAINKQPFVPGQVGATGLFQEDSVSTTIVSIEMADGKLGLVEPTRRGGPGETVDDETRTVIPFEVDHYERNDTVLADEVQNVRAFGSESELEQLVDRVVRKGARHLRDLDATLEHQRVGALKGIVTSKSGRVLHDLYARFGIAVPAPVSLELDIETTKVGELINGVKYSIEDDLDEAYTGLHAFAGREFYSALWNHKWVRETYLASASDAAMLRREMPEKFEYAGVVWERYRTGMKAAASVGAPFIAADEARIVPTGVPDLFMTRFAPADYEETVNTPGLPRYMRQYAMPNGKGRHLDVQSNPISVCTRPAVLRRLTLT